MHIVGKGKTNTSTTSSKAKAKAKAAVAPGTGGGAPAPASDVSAPHVAGDVGGARGGRQHQEPPLQRQVSKNEHNNLLFGSAHGPFSQLLSSSSATSGGAEQLLSTSATQHKQSMTVDLSSVLTQRPPLNQNQLRRASYTFKRKILTDPDFLTEEVAVDRKGVLGENAPAEGGDLLRHLPAEGHPRTRPTTSSTTGGEVEQKTGSQSTSSSTPPPVVMILAADLDPTRSVVWDGVGRHSSSGAAGGLQTPLRASVTSRFQDEEQEDVLREWESWLVETDSAEAFKEEPDLFSYWREAVEEAKLEEMEEMEEEQRRAALVESSQSRGRGGEDSTSEQDERPRDEEERQLERPLGDDRTTSTTTSTNARTLQRKWAKVFERFWPEEESWLHLFLTPFLPIFTAVCPLWARALLAEAVFGEGVRFPTMNWALAVRERVFGVWAPPAASSGQLVVPGSGLEPIGALAGDQHQVDGKNSSSTFHRTSTSCKASSSGVDEYLNVPVFVREDLALFFPQYTNFFLLFSSSPACRTTFSEGEQTESCVKEEDTAPAVLELGDHGEVLANKTTVVGRGGSDVIDVEVSASHNATQTSNAGSPASTTFTAATPATSFCENVCAPRASGSLADDTQDERNKAPDAVEPEDVGSFGRRRKKSMLRMAAEHLCSCTERMTTEGTTSSCEQTHHETTSTSTTGGVVRGENLVSEQLELGEHDEPLEVESADYMMMEIDVATKPRPSGGAAEVDTQQQERARDVEVEHTSRTTSTTTEHNTSTRSRRRANLMDEKAMPLEEPPEPPAQWVVRPRHQQLEEAPRRFHVTLMEKYRRGQDIGTYNAYDMAPH